MTTRSTEFSGKCLCGNGTVTIEYCEVDHGWPTATPSWYEHALTCESCEKTYRLIKQESKFFYITLADEAEREKRMQLVREKEAEILGTVTSQQVRHSFLTQLESGSSMAAKFRFLNQLHLETTSVATFRKWWRNSEKWMESNFRVINLRRMYEATGTAVAELDANLVELAELRKSAEEPCPRIGDLIYSGTL